MTEHGDELFLFEQAVLAQAPSGALTVGASISPDGKHAVALTVLPSVHNYPMDDLFERVENQWVEAGGGSGGGICWTTLDDGGDGTHGVLRFGGEAPDGAMAAWVVYEGIEHRVPARHGHFLFVAWSTPYADEPSVIRFE